MELGPRGEEISQRRGGKVGINIIGIVMVGYDYAPSIAFITIMGFRVFVVPRPPLPKLCGEGGRRRLCIR